MSGEELIVKKYANIVYGLAFRDTAEPEDAETVFSEVFTKYFEEDRRFETEQQRGEWFVQATTSCAEQLRKQRSENG